MKDSFIIKYRWLIILGSITIVLMLIYPLLNTGINTNIESYLPESMSSRKNQMKIQEIFGEDDPVIILFESKDVLNDSTLKRIQKLSRQFNQMKEYDRVLSLFDAKKIEGESGMMIVDPVIKRIPVSEDKREKLRDEIRDNSLVYKFIVSEDFRFTNILLNPAANISDEEIITPILQLLEKYPGSEKISIFGQPYLRYEANNKVVKDFAILLPIGLLLMFIFLVISFRQFRGAILPFMVVVFSIIISLSIIPVFNWQLSIIGIIIPIMMIAIANDYGIHFISYYQELTIENPDKTARDLSIETTKFLAKPILLTGLTTMAGIGGLITHIMLPAKQLGVAAVVGIAFAVLFSLSYIPAVNSLLKKRAFKFNFRNNNHFVLQRILGKISRLTTQNPRLLISIFLAFFIFSVLGLKDFRLAADNNKIFSDQHPYNRSLKIIDQEMGGTKNINIIFEGDIKDPGILNRMTFYEQELKKMPQIGSVNSIATIIRIMSKAINEEGDSLYDKIPSSRNAVAQYLELYFMSGDPEDFEDFINFDYSKARLSIQYTANTMEALNEIENKIKALVKNDENITLIGGYSLVEKELSEAVAKGQSYSLIFAFMVIVILLWIIFRSFSAGLLGGLPLLYTIFCIFGIMGWAGIELNIVTALLSSISIGLGVDYAIHLFWRIRSEINNGKKYHVAISNSILTTGRGITINALSVIIGFALLFLSSFPYIQSFAFLIVISIALCLMGAIILIPAICMLTKPKFLSQ